MASASHCCYNIGGIATHVYGLEEAEKSLPLTVLFFLHGRSRRYNYETMIRMTDEMIKATTLLKQRKSSYVTSIKQ